MKSAAGSIVSALHIVRRYRGGRAPRAWTSGAVLLISLSACGSQQTTQTPAPYSTVTGPRGTEMARTVFPYKPIPRGWKTYKGMGVPFAIAYPAHWSVDEANSPVGEISFLGNEKTSSISGTLATRELASQPVGLDVLRGRFLNVVTRVCEGGKRIGKAGRARFSQVTFATVTAACSGSEEGENEEVKAFYLGVAKIDGRQWTFSFSSHQDELARNTRQYFVPMLKTLHIYRRS